MILMDTHIVSLCKQGLIDPKHAFEKVVDQEGFKDMLSGRSSPAAP
ncbi:MAG: hypothetical protein HQ583_02565 [Candidatus Abyssubacteria bacterium]|nr:hypothetical protein [Candidatus Abyssubacteria bacterium]